MLFRIRQLSGRHDTLAEAFSAKRQIDSFVMHEEGENHPHIAEMKPDF